MQTQAAHRNTIIKRCEIIVYWRMVCLFKLYQRLVFGKSTKAQLVTDAKLTIGVGNCRRNTSCRIVFVTAAENQELQVVLIFVWSATTRSTGESGHSVMMRGGYPIPLRTCAKRTHPTLDMYCHDTVARIHLFQIFSNTFHLHNRLHYSSSPSPASIAARMDCITK